MYIDNVKISTFTTTVNDIDNMINQINSIKKDGEIIQLLNADSIAGMDHIFHGINQAFLSFKKGMNLANDIGVEIVLRISAQRQISKAFDILGLKNGEMNICVIFINCDYSNELSSIFNLNKYDLVYNNKQLMKIYNISNTELENFSIEEIIIDRITKLTVDY